MKMSRWKSIFENVLWSSRLIVLLAVITSVLGGLDLFLVVGAESFRVVAHLIQSAAPGLPSDQREAILRLDTLRMITLIDGYLLGAFMFIFGFGLYELFLGDLDVARSSHASGKILRISSLEDLKTRLGKVILIILIVEIFKDAYDVKATSALDLLYVATAIALIGLGLFLTHASAPEKTPEPAPND
jgi:uncharacterized membrane protein YqhA